MIDFKKSYKRDSFLDFLRQILPDDFDITLEESLIIGFQTKYIRNISLLGSCKSIKIKVYEAEHESEYDPRVSLSREIFKIMAAYGTERALVIFKSLSSENYRFSLVTVDLRLEGIKVRKEYSNPRRYSFYLGPDAKVATPGRYLLSKGKVKDFGDFNSRFSIEVVNKEFYNAIAKSFSKLVGGKRKIGSHLEEFKGLLKLPSKEDIGNRGKEFAVRLIGRIIFCWFLKKKYSDNGLSLISDKLLSLDAAQNNKNYYHFILEPLFFQVLNTPQEKRIEEYHKEIFNDIPFLNGGLFDKHPDDWYETTDSIFGISKFLNTLKVPDDWFLELFETLEIYNFTIDENTTIDIDLSVDPEMLGRIFENLLAEINPETEESARKATGSYYTPRLIVDYMVTESLKQFLFTRTGISINAIDDLLSYEIADTDLSDHEKEKVLNALNDIKIIDPACGSGAFPMGVLQKMVLVLQKVDPDSRKWLESVLATISDPTARGMMRKKLENEKDLWDYTRKIGIIRKSIYGVDIQPIAVEIAKLRCFLSLIVEEKVIDKEDNRNIEPLPNLDFKFVCANSLIDVPLQIDDSDALIKDTFFGELEHLIQEYFQAWEPERKKELHVGIENLIDSKVEEKEKALNNFIQGIFGKKTLSKKDKEKKDILIRERELWDSYKNIFKGDPVKFFNIRHFFPEVSLGFDISISNPPYVRADSGEQHLILRKEIEKTGIFDTLWEKWDLYIPFIERGYKLLRNNGITTMIVSDAYCHSKYAQKSQEWFLKNSSILRLDFLSKLKIFDAGVHNIIYFFKKTDGQFNFPERAVHFPEFGKVTFLKTDKQNKLDYRAFFPEDNKMNFIFENSIELDNICYISYGLRPSSDENEAKGEFTTDDLTSEIKDSIHNKPFVEGKHLGKWIPITNIYLEWGTNRAPSKFCRPTFIELYEVNEKILSQRSPGPDPKACYDNNKFLFTPSSVGFIPWHLLKGIKNNSLKKVARYHSEKQKAGLPHREELEKISSRFCVKYLLAIMNSSVAHQYLRSNRRSNIHLYPDDWKSLPIPDVDSSKQKTIISIVDKIITAKQKDLNADVSTLESKIDNLVCNLYGITQEEIAIIEKEV